jgi:hypothetical protein
MLCAADWNPIWLTFKFTVFVSPVEVLVVVRLSAPLLSLNVSLMVPTAPRFQVLEKTEVTTAAAPLASAFTSPR